MGGGLVVLMVDDVWLADHADAQESGGGARHGFSQRLPEELNAWLHIGQGVITGFTGKVEIGQNARTSLTRAIVEGGRRLRPQSERMRDRHRQAPLPLRF